ncbi:tumor necrosis factor receptor superfamily member 1A isoform X3 [Equus caballus]|uniref:tumor necrosis factor receptor superfamily member 1A isoform X3 n=1 Tax=Equus caballus TaxID=9796 RepID=UPI000717CB1C
MAVSAGRPPSAGSGEAPSSSLPALGAASAPPLWTHCGGLCFCLHGLLPCVFVLLHLRGAFSLSACRFPSWESSRGLQPTLMQCQGSVLQPCSATRDTVCAVETNQEPDERLTPSLQGNRNSSEPFIAVAVAVAVAVVVVVVLLIVFIIVVYQKKGVQIRRWVVGCLKRESEEPGSPPPARSQSDDALLPPDPERDPSAAGVETERELEEESLALDPGAGSCPGLSEDPEESIELQVTAICVPGAHGPQGLAEQHRSLSSLEQEYEQTYFLKDTSSKTTSQTYYIFGQEVTPSKWNMFMTLIGLEGNEIERCRYENQGNLIEVHHEMLVMWRSKLGREASIFKLMAALHQMQLRTCLENIINKLIAENILAKHAETPN